MSSTGVGPLATDVLDAIRAYDTPTMANAIETFDFRARNEGFMGADIRSIFPDMPTTLGYAVTGRIRSAAPSTRPYSPKAWWQHVLTVPEPRVLVFEDLDDPPGVGAFWGEVQTNIHRALGCVGVVTNGSVRDLLEVQALGFAYFARQVAVSHAYVHLVDFGSDVTISGVTVKEGDLLQGDRHGVLTLPIDRAPELPAAAVRLIARERRIIDFCRSKEFDVDGLAAVMS